jgi:acid phosphatase
MGVLSTLFKSLPVLAASVIAVDYPPIPSDKTTPVQQRIAVNGANCELFNHNARS